METTVGTNGQAKREMSHQDILADLESQLTTGYKHELPLDGMFGLDGTGMMPLNGWKNNIELMIRHPVVKQALGYFKSGIAGAQFWGGPHPDNPDDETGLPICPQDDKVGRFIKEQCERFWDRGVPHVQGGYDHGWIGGEHIYDEADGTLKWDSVKTFAPQDTYLLTRDHVPVGIRVKNVQESTEDIDLWLAGESVPAKGMWYGAKPATRSQIPWLGCSPRQTLIASWIRE